MANRFIKSSIWTSPNLNRLTADGELLFYRLLPLPDDHGCFEADPRVIRGTCFPKKMEPGPDVADVWDLPRIISATIDIICYQLISSWVSEDRLYGIFLEWSEHQQVRSKYKRKTPEPPTDIDSIVKSGQIGRVGKFLDDIVISCNQLLSVDASSPSSLLSSHFSLPSPLLSADADQDTKQPPLQKQKVVTNRPKKEPTGDHQAAIDYFCQRYQDEVQTAYKFHGNEDGAKVKQLLKRGWTLSQIKCLIDTMFASTDHFYKTGGGYSIGVLLANDNKLVQEAKRKAYGQDGLSPAGEATARAAAKILEEDRCEAETKQLSLPE